MTGRCFLLLICLLAGLASGLELEFLQEDYAVIEGGSTIVNIVKNNANQFPVSLDVTPMTYAQYAAGGGVLPPEIASIIDTVSPIPAQFDSSAGGRRDFSNQAISVTFPPSLGTDSMEITIATMDDLINESNEGYLLVIQVTDINSADNAMLTLIREGVALVRITDNDEISISFREMQYTVSEAAGVVSNLVVLEKTNGVESEQNITIILVFQANSATAGDDYVDVSQMSITFLPTDVSLFVSFEILDDSDAEENEFFFLQITLPNNPASGLAIRSNPSATITIEDDDSVPIQVGFTQESFTVTEGQIAQITYAILSDINLVTVSNFVSFDIEVFESLASTADYDLSGFNDFGFLDGFVTSNSVAIPTIDDSEAEGSEDFLLRLTLRQGAGNIDGDFELIRSQATVFIMDNDGGGASSLELLPNPSLTGIEGEMVTFMCGPLGADPITLLVNGIEDTSISFVDSTENRTFSVGPLTRDMTGTTFQCTTASLMSEVSTLLVFFPPEYTVGTFFEGNEGDSPRIDLSLDGFPLPPDVFSWTFNGQPLMSEMGRPILGVDFIQFNSLQRDDRGTYMVTASNLAGSGNASFVIEVYYPPAYVSDPVYTFVEGELSTVQLSLDARPLPGAGEFMWSFNGQPLSGSSNLVLDEDTLTWTAVSRSDVGSYFVEATNRAGSGNTTFQVEIVYPPTYMVDDRIVVIEGNPVRVDLALDANPIPSTFEWEYNGQPLPMVVGGELGVDFIDFGGSISRSDSGMYFIESSNIAGAGNATFELVVYFPPEYTVNASYSVQEGEPFDLTLGLEGLPFPVDDNVTWFFNGQVLAMMAGISFGRDFINIQMATRLDTGTYRVEATNEAGTGEASFDLQVIVPVASTSSPGPMPTPTRVPVEFTSFAVSTTQLSEGPVSMTTPSFSSSSPAISPTPMVTTDPPTTTVFGDPHFSVLLPTGQLLCYSVQGEHGYSFNLVSNKMLQMNARFVPDARREEVTWIGSLGIVITSRRMNETRIRFEAEEKAIHIGDKLSLHVNKIDKLTFSKGKLTISEALRDKKAKHLCVEVEVLDLGLLFSVDFVRGHLDMSWSKIGKQLSSSHGIIGQFFRPHIEIDEIRRLLLLPDMEPVSVMRKPVWHFMERESPDEQLCWVAMNPGYQGKKLLQGHYLDYLVDDVLSTNFKFKPKKHKKAKRDM